VEAARGSLGAVEAALERLGLSGRLRTVTVARLSAGQRRRTALAALVARQPELWLLDEPHAGLDAEHRDLLDDIILRAATGGAAVVMASHERDRASSLADRVFTMAGGLVLPAGPPAAEPAFPEPSPGLRAPPEDVAIAGSPATPPREAAHVA
jgi:energy-coupling factor transporter ATP-binding protein EcfA2